MDLHKCLFARSKTALVEEDCEGDLLLPGLVPKPVLQLGFWSNFRAGCQNPF